MEKAKGGEQYHSTTTTAAEVLPTITDMGLTHKQSSKYQQLFDVPEEEFTGELAKLNGAHKPQRLKPICVAKTCNDPCWAHSVGLKRGLGSCWGRRNLEYQTLITMRFRILKCDQTSAFYPVALTVSLMKNGESHDERSCHCYTNWRRPEKT